MSTETHEGVVAFRRLSPGREQIVLGSINVGDLPKLDSHLHLRTMGNSQVNLLM